MRPTYIILKDYNKAIFVEILQNYLIVLMIYYNESRINKADGVAIYIHDNIIENTESIVIDRWSILHSKIKQENINSCINISALYRSHDMSKY